DEVRFETGRRCKGGSKMPSPSLPKTLILAVMLGACTPAFAAECGDLLRVAIDTVTITAAERREAATLDQGAESERPLPRIAESRPSFGRAATRTSRWSYGCRTIGTASSWRSATAAGPARSASRQWPTACDPATR